MELEGLSYSGTQHRAIEDARNMAGSSSRRQTHGPGQPWKGQPMSALSNIRFLLQHAIRVELRNRHGIAGLLVFAVAAVCTCCRPPAPLPNKKAGTPGLGRLALREVQCRVETLGR